MTRGRIVLLGDSIFDNQSYVARHGATIDAVRARIPEGWSALLLAQDGSSCDEVARQILHVPSDASHLVVSTGGNDALSHAGILAERATTVGEGLWKLAQIADRFERCYREMVRSVRARKLPTVLCTIYNGNFPEHLQTVTTTALTVYNDAIIRTAWSAALPVIDLRRVCSEPEDYANEIEPSVRGGEKIADAIVSALGIAE